MLHADCVCCTEYLDPLMHIHYSRHDGLNFVSDQLVECLALSNQNISGSTLTCIALPSHYHVHHMSLISQDHVSLPYTIRFLCLMQRLD